MHDSEHRPDSLAISFDSPGVMSAGSASFTAAIHARTPLGLSFPDIAGDSVDIINDLRTGALVRKQPGVPLGPQSRAFELTTLPDFGAGTLALPGLARVGTRGSVTFVNDSGVAATGTAITGIALAGGAYLRTQSRLPASLDLGGGWSITMRYRVPVGASNSSRVWLSLGRQDADGSYGIQIGESASGQLSALFIDPRHATITARSLAVPRGTVATARLTWNASTRQAQWFINGVASGSAATVPFMPDVATGDLLVGTNLSQSTSVTPNGAIFQITLESANAGVGDSFVSIGAVATLSAAEAAQLEIDTLNQFAAVPDAGTISVRYASASGPSGSDLAVSIAGYRNVVERLPRFVSASSPWSSVDLGTTVPAESALILTAPDRGTIGSAASGAYNPVGSLFTVAQDSGRPYVRIEPDGAENPAGPIPRGWTGMLRIQQREQVREFPLTELNLAPKLNGGGEGWGHPDDIWVPLHSLWYGYVDADYLYPTIAGETPTVTVTAVPAAGEGAVRIGRAGADLRVGDVVPFTSVRRIGWFKPGVSAVGPDCMLGLRVSTPGAAASDEVYRLKITDAARPPEFGYWAFANTNFSDGSAQIRWAARGGDWSGVDGLYGATPFAQTAAVTSAQTLTIDVTSMVRAHGPEAFIVCTTSGTVGISPPNSTSAPANEPMLRVVGGARAGMYRATRYASLADSDSTTWRPTFSGNVAVRRNVPFLLAFDGAGPAGGFADSTRIELVLVVNGVSGGGGALQVFRPTPQPPRQGPRVAFNPTPARSRADFLVGVDRNEDWNRLLASASPREQRATDVVGITIANGCYYGGIPAGGNTGLNMYRGFWREDGSGYPVVRLGRMVGWHTNFQPADGANHPGVSGKCTGLIATGKAALDGVDVGRGGIRVSGLGGYTCRTQRGVPPPGQHRSTSPLHKFLPIGDYNYFINGSTNGQINIGIVPVPRMKWVWIETVHRTNTVLPDGRWLKDGSFEMFVNGRKYCEYFGLEYRIAGNPWLWDAIWLLEFNGGTGDWVADRLWPFVAGPVYAVASDQPIAPPADWNVPFVDALGRPEATPTPYIPD